MQLWDGLAIHGEKNIDKRHILATWQNVGVNNRLRTDHVAQLMSDYFKIPLASATLAKVR
ncbi:hypothetical protein D3C86_1639240 [compost metagenome]